MDHAAEVAPCDGVCAGRGAAVVLVTANSITVNWLPEHLQASWLDASEGPAAGAKPPVLRLTLAPHSPAPGEHVVVQGLQSAAGQALNGQRATVLGRDEASGRFCIQLAQGGGAQKRVKGANLRRADSSASARRGRCETVTSAATQHTFFLLPPSTDFEVLPLGLRACTLPAASLPARRLPCWGCSHWEPFLYVHPPRPAADASGGSAGGALVRLGVEWAVHAPGDWLWTASWDYALQQQLYAHALFTLPDSEGGEGQSLLMLPNPEGRYCIDLALPREKGGAPVRWDLGCPSMQNPCSCFPAQETHLPPIKKRGACRETRTTRPW